MKAISSIHKWYLDYEKKIEARKDLSISKRADGIGPIAPMKLKKMENPDKILDKYDDSDIWVQQKIDGFKTQAIKDKGGAVKLYTRRGEGFEANVPNLVKALSDKMSPGDFWLGELAYVKNGKQSISDVQTVVGSSPENAQKKLKEGSGKLVFYVYDLLWDSGKNITKSPYSQRYEKLKKKVGKSDIVEIVKNYSYSDKDKAINDALKAGGEGIVLKPKDSEYKYGSKGSSEPVGEWAKHKPKGKKANTDEVILNKYEKGEDKLIFPMYQYKDGKLFEVGKISGMSKEDEAKIKKDIDAGKSIVVEISFQERMESGKFRHPGWSRFRPDKPVKEVKVSALKPALSKRAAVTTLYGIGKDIEEQLKKLPGYGAISFDPSESQQGIISYGGKFFYKDVEIIWTFHFFSELNVVNQDTGESMPVPNMYKATVSLMPKSGPYGQYMINEIYQDPYDAINDLHTYISGFGRGGEADEDYDEIMEELKHPIEPEEEEVAEVIPFPKKESFYKAISKRAVKEITEESTEEITPLDFMEPVSSMRAEREYDKLVERMKEYTPADYEKESMDPNFDQEVDLRSPEPFDVLRYFLFDHYKREKYKPYNKEMLKRLLEIQPSKFFDANLFSEDEFFPYLSKAVEAVARLEPQYFIDFLAWALPKESVERYLNIAKESLRTDDRSLEERRHDLLQKAPWDFPKRGAISKRAGRLDYPKKMLNEILDWIEKISPSLKKRLFRKPKKERLMRYFDIDLSDTDLFKKHPALVERLKEMQDEGWHEALHVAVYSKDPGSVEASYNSPAVGMHEIEIFVPDKHKNLRASLIHELTHMVQKILTTLVWPSAKGKPAGLPGYYNPETYKMYGKMSDFERGDDITVWHSRSDIEFFSKLNEEIELMKEYLSKFDNKNEAFNNFLRRNEFLRRLRGYNDTNYKKALREFYRAFDELRQTKISCRQSFASQEPKFKEGDIVKVQGKKYKVIESHWNDQTEDFEVVLRRAEPPSGPGDPPTARPEFMLEKSELDDKVKEWSELANLRYTRQKAHGHDEKWEDSLEWAREKIFDKKANIKLSSRADIYGGWISPQGKFYEVEPYSHISFIINNQDLFGTLGEHDRFPADIDELAGHRGWIRAVIGHDRVSFDVPELNDSVVRKVQNVLNKFPRKKFVEIWEMGSESTILIPYSEFVAAYDVRDLRRSKIASEHEYTYGWWMSPTGKLHKVNSAGGHVAFIRQNPDIFGKTDEENDDYDLAFKKDWIRIINSYERLIFEFPSKNDKYLQRVQKKLNELPEKRIVSFVFDGIHEIDVPYSVFANAWDFRDIERSRNAVIKGAAEKDPEFMTHLDPEKKYVSEPEGFMRDVETGEREPAYLDESICEDCGETMPLDVHKSAAGWYIGRFCKNCGPHSRESGYFKNEKEARDALDEYKMSQEGPEEFEQIDVSKMASISKRAKDPLSKYKGKRDTKGTPEPEGKTEKGKNKHRFVIQDHKATKHHWDLRLEDDDGTLHSWSVPKHHAPKKDEKLLAVRTENHPISYMHFSGEIPYGEYGAGTVKIVQKGTYKPIEYTNKKVIFEVSAGKIKGKWVLVHTKDKNWLWMRYKGDENEKV